MTDAPTLWFQGTSALNGAHGVTFGDGLRCVGGTIVRLAIHVNVGGASQYPGVGDASISQRGGVTAGDVRFYQAYYRNAASFCTSAPFNLTNAVGVRWGP